MLRVQDIENIREVKTRRGVQQVLQSAAKDQPPNALKVMSMGAQVYVYASPPARELLNTYTMFT